MSTETQTTRFELEYNTRWAQEQPKLFARSVEDFIEKCVQYDLFDIRMNIKRVGFVTLIATEETL